MLRFGYLRITFKLTWGYFYKSQISVKSKLGLKMKTKAKNEFRETEMYLPLFDVGVKLTSLPLFRALGSDRK